jgi:hypothetical protein
VGAGSCFTATGCWVLLLLMSRLLTAAAAAAAELLLLLLLLLLLRYCPAFVPAAAILCASRSHQFNNQQFQSTLAAVGRFVGVINCSSLSRASTPRCTCALIQKSGSMHFRAELLAQCLRCVSELSCQGSGDVYTRWLLCELLLFESAAIGCHAHAVQLRILLWGEHAENRILAT